MWVSGSAKRPLVADCVCGMPISKMSKENYTEDFFKRNFTLKIGYRNFFYSSLGPV